MSAEVHRSTTGVDGPPKDAEGDPRLGALITIAPLRCLSALVAHAAGALVLAGIQGTPFAQRVADLGEARQLAALVRRDASTLAEDQAAPRVVRQRARILADQAEELLLEADQMEWRTPAEIVDLTGHRYAAVLQKVDTELEQADQLLATGRRVDTRRAATIAARVIACLNRIAVLYSYGAPGYEKVQRRQLKADWIQREAKTRLQKEPGIRLAQLRRLRRLQRGAAPANEVVV